MGIYRARDLALAPNVISMLRVPLAAAFPYALSEPRLALGVLFTAGATDVLDGWLARSRNQATPIGAVVDPITDKLFVATVMISLIATGRLPLWGALMLSTRELGELPLVTWWALSRARRRAKTDAPRANIPGKVATTLQFVAVALSLVRSEWLSPALFAASLGGALAAIGYWVRELVPDQLVADRRRASGLGDQVAGSGSGSSSGSTTVGKKRSRSALAQ